MGFARQQASGQAAAIMPSRLLAVIADDAQRLRGSLFEEDDAFSSRRNSNRIVMSRRAQLGSQVRLCGACSARIASRVGSADRQVCIADPDGAEGELRSEAHHRIHHE